MARLSRLIAQALVGSAIIATGIYVPLLVHKHLGLFPALLAIWGIAAAAWIVNRPPN